MQLPHTHRCFPYMYGPLRQCFTWSCMSPCQHLLRSTKLKQELGHVMNISLDGFWSSVINLTLSPTFHSKPPSVAQKVSGSPCQPESLHRNPTNSSEKFGSETLWRTKHLTLWTSVVCAASQRSLQRWSDFWSRADLLCLLCREFQAYIAAHLPPLAAREWRKGKGSDDVRFHFRSKVIVVSHL